MLPILYYLGLCAGGYFALTVFLYILSLAFPIAGFLARLLASYVCLVTCATYGIIISIALRLVGYGGLSQWMVARSFKYTMRYATGVRFEIEDPNDYLNTSRPAVYIGNHQTELDVLALGYIFPPFCSVTAKKSLKSIPFLGWFMNLSGSVFIDRANSTSARTAMSGAVDEIQKKKQSVYMFPEGTRSYAREPILLPFKKGAFHLAVQAGVPIVPIVVANYSSVLFVQGWKFNSGTIPIKVLKPIETKNLTAADVDALTQNVRESMLNELVSLTAKARGEPVAMSTQDSGDGIVKASGAKL